MSPHGSVFPTTKGCTMSEKTDTVDTASKAEQLTGLGISASISAAAAVVFFLLDLLIIGLYVQAPRNPLFAGAMIFASTMACAWFVWYFTQSALKYLAVLATPEDSQ